MWGISKMSDSIMMALYVAMAGIVVSTMMYLYFSKGALETELNKVKLDRDVISKRYMAESLQSRTFKAQIDKQNAIYSSLSIEYDKKVMDFERWKHDNREKTIKEDIPSLEGESDECEDILFAIDNLRANGM